MSDSLGFDDRLFSSECPHEADPLEWWFVHGYYENAAKDGRYFMASVFRSRVANDTSDSDHGWFLLLSVLNPALSEHRSHSRIDRTIRNLATPRYKGKWQGNLDRLIVETYADEVLKYGPPRPIRLADTSVAASTNPFGIVWDDFSLHQLQDGFQINYVEPDRGCNCRFHLKPLHPRIVIDRTESPRADAMTYASYPTMELRGDAAGEEVTGWAWFDHQWGSVKGWFFRNPGKDRLLGWDWLGINLEDGTELIVMLHRDMECMEPVSRFAVLRRGNDRPCILTDFTMTPRRYWTSEVTRVRYPVEWQVDIPGIGLSLHVEPFSDDQEIAVFGVMRAIWEGAGRVSGTMGDTAVSGRARLELHGYGYIFDFNKHIEGLIDHIDKHIEDYLPRTISEAQLQRYLGEPSWKHEPSAYTEMITRPIWDMLSRGGKHWRPLFGMFMLGSLGVTSGLFDRLICVISELPHVGTLIVDDIEDKSQVRRGQECVHLRYGDDLAINAGNTLYFVPYLILENHPHLTDAQRLRMYEIMVKRLSQAHFGQALDLYWSRNMTPSNLQHWMNDSIGPKILQMYAYKTAAVVEGLAELACVIAQAGGCVRETCVTFGRAFGVAFQIVDDVNDFSESHPGTKVRGEDISSAKLTYVVWRALEQLSEAKRSRLKDILGSEQLRQGEESLEEAIDLVHRSGAIESCRNLARTTLHREWERLSEKLPSSEPKIMLRTLCESLLNVMHDV